MRLRRVAFVVLLAAVALASALAVLPARWLLAVLPPAWPVALVDASGTVWQGQALIAVGPLGLRRTLPAPLTWQWQWQWQNKQGPTLLARHPVMAGPLPLSFGWHGVTVGAQQARLPASLLIAAGAPINSIDPSGDLQLSWPDLNSSALPERGPLLTVQWNQAGSSRVRVHPLGTYRAVLAREPSNVTTLKIQTLEGQLQLAGEGRHTRAQGWRFEGTAQPAQNADNATQEALMPLLNMIGRREGSMARLQFPYSNTP